MTPSFVKRMRNNTGRRATFSFGSKRTPRNITVQVQDVEWNNGEYVLVGKVGASTRRFPTNEIHRPVRYSN